MVYNVKPGQLVECRWLDPAAGSNWIAAQEVGFYRFECRSVGFVHAVDDDGLVLTASDGVDGDGDRSLLLRQHLPWSAITDLWVLEER